MLHFTYFVSKKHALFYMLLHVSGLRYINYVTCYMCLVINILTMLHDTFVKTTVSPNLPCNVSGCLKVSSKEAILSYLILCCVFNKSVGHFLLINCLL